MRQARIRNLCAVERQGPQVPKHAQARQARIGHGGAVKARFVNFVKPPNDQDQHQSTPYHEDRVVSGSSIHSGGPAPRLDGCLIEVQVFQVLLSVQMSEPGIGDFRANEFDSCQVLQSAQINDFRIRNRRVIQCDTLIRSKTRTSFHVALTHERSQPFRSVGLCTTCPPQLSIQ